MADSDEGDRYWAKLMGQATVILAGASDAELRVQLYETLEEFFDHSNCWSETINLTVVPELLEYPLVPVTGRILRLSNVLDQNNVPQQAVMSPIGVVRFLYPYTNVQPMTAIVVKTVTDPMCCHPPHIPDWVLPAYGRGILHGLLGNMMMQPGQSYSNLQMGMLRLGRFRGEIAHARVAASKANTIGAQSWAFPQQFRVSGQRGGVSTFNVNPMPLRQQ
jgi:hypothetical protein